MSAILIPSVPSKLTSGETRILKSLASCYEHGEGVFIYIQPRIRNLEPDFIVIDPSRGIAILEVKDWGLDSIKSLNKLNVTFVDGKQDKNPAFKTNRYFNLVKGVLEADQALYNEQGGFVPKLSARLIMSRMTDTALQQVHENLDQFPCQVFGSNAIAKMSLRDIFGDNACQMTAEQVTACRAALFPEIKIRRHTNEVLATIRALDSQQEQFAKRLPHGHAMVSGVPGSGKTVILLSRALYLAKENPDWQILIITYNKSLRSRLQSRIHAIENDLSFMGIPYTNITIATFHSCALELANLIVPQEQDQTFWDVTLPQAAMLNATPRFDAVLIDEYQDFCEDWFRVCVKLVRPHTVDDALVETLFLAGDRLQSIYNRAEFTWANVGINVVGGQRSKLLKHTYRTGKSHITLALDYLMTHDHLRREVERFYEGRDGIQNVSNIADEIGFILGDADVVVDHIQTLINKAHFDPADILVLAPVWRTAQDIFNKLPQNQKLVSRVSKDVDEGVMIFTTYHSAKGLERKVVILTDVNAVNDPRLVYVGMTRASDRLYIHARNRETPSVMSTLTELAGKLQDSVGAGA
jgi:superfamily I DNA and RNA helicase